MKLPTEQFVAQTSAVIAVVVSLGFVGYELKQARDVATAELTLNTIMSYHALTLATFDADAYNRANEKRVGGEERTQVEWQNQLRMVTMKGDLWFAQFTLSKMGLLAEDEWLARQSEIYMHIKHNEDYRKVYDPNSGEGLFFSDAFREKVIVPIYAAIAAEEASEG